MPVLSDYTTQLQNLLNDPLNQFSTEIQKTYWINQARHRIAGEAQCVRVLTQSSGSLSAISVTAGGSGYTSATVTISSPDAMGVNFTQATATATVLAGAVTGFFVAQKRLLLAGSGTSLSGKMEQNPTSAGAIKVGDTFGTKDEGTFRDSAEGILMSGGIDGEGSHHIERGENKSQWVYVTSSVVDLDMFVGHRVQVWGETNQGKKAGWLMDVGKLKVLELNVAPVTSDSATQD